MVSNLGQTTKFWPYQPNSDRLLLILAMWPELGQTGQTLVVFIAANIMTSYA